MSDPVRIELRLVPSCEGCGACCRTIGLPPFEAPNPALGIPLRGELSERQRADAEVFERMPAALRAEHAGLVRALAADPTGAPCPWLDPDTKACRHYEFRPANCRAWVVGSAGCHAMRNSPTALITWAVDNRPERWRNPLLAQEVVGEAA